MKLPTNFIEKLQGLTLYDNQYYMQKMGISTSTLWRAKKGDMSNPLALAFSEVAKKEKVWDGSTFLLDVSNDKKYVKKLRLFLGLSQKQLAEKLGLYQSSVSFIETGKLPLEKKYVSNLEKLASQSGLKLRFKR